MKVKDIIYVAYHDEDGKPHINVYDTTVADENIVLLRTLDLTYIDDFSFYSMCIDEDGNIFIQGYHRADAEDELIKIDALGNILNSVICDEAEPHCDITVGPDGYIYTNDEADDRLNKRDPVTLEVIAYRSMNNKDYDGLAFYSNTGYIVGNYSDGYIERWDFVSGYIERRSIDTDYIVNVDFAVSGEILLGFKPATTNDAWTSPMDLSEAALDWVIDGIPRMIAVGVLNNEDFLLAGEVVNNGAQFLARYTSARVFVWKEEILDAYNYIVEVKAYPFVPVEVYDYPLAPVMFPAEPRSTTLKKDCINFEESMSDVCLVVNHNTRVTREYLQLTYDGEGFNESSNLRFILPSQQLVKLQGKDLDYNAIINNFIKNVSSTFTLINENNTIIKQWLDDYEPDEEGHEFTDVKMRPIVVGKDLTKTMDALFEGIIDNVTILNMNLEVLKERF